MSKSNEKKNINIKEYIPLDESIDYVFPYELYEGAKYRKHADTMNMKLHEKITSNIYN